MSDEIFLDRQYPDAFRHCEQSKTQLAGHGRLQTLMTTLLSPLTFHSLRRLKRIPVSGQACMTIFSMKSSGTIGSEVMLISLPLPQWKTNELGRDRPSSSDADFTQNQRDLDGSISPSPALVAVIDPVRS